MAKNGKKRRPTAVSGQTGNRNMAETENLNSQPYFSYSVPITLSVNHDSFWQFTLTIMPMLMASGVG